MKKLLLLVFALVLSAVFCYANVPLVQAVEAITDEAPNRNFDQGTRAQGDFIGSVDMGAITGDDRLLGVEMDGDSWFMTGARDYSGCYLYEVDYDSNALVNTWSTGHSGWGWRDMCYDGEFLYASDSFCVEQIDPATGAATGVTIPCPISPCRALAYDRHTDTFWGGNFGADIYNFTRDGTVLTTFANPGLSVYGAAIEPDGDVLWLWSQDGSGSLASAMDPTTGLILHSWDGDVGIGGVAGGACIFVEPVKGLVFAGMQQAGSDMVTEFELDVTTPRMKVKCNGKEGTKEKPVEVAEGAMVNLTVDVLFPGFAGGQKIEIWVWVYKISPKPNQLWNLVPGKWKKVPPGPIKPFTTDTLKAKKGIPIGKKDDLDPGRYVARVDLETLVNKQYDPQFVIAKFTVFFEVKKKPLP